MSSWKDKLYNHEVTPPSKTWEQIADELDEASLTNRFPDILYNLEAAPAGNAWEKIAAGLDGSPIADRFPDRLYAMEVTPPANVWPVILSSISTKEQTRERPLLRRITPFVRYAAAAIVIGVVAFSIIKFALPGNTPINAGTFVKDQDNDSSDAGGKKLADPASEAPALVKDSPGNSDAVPVQNNALVADQGLSVKTVSRKLRRPANEDRYAEKVDPELIQSIYAYEDHVPNLADRYVMLMTPDGNIIRMSKKWSELLCCVSGEEQDPDCKDQLKKWQQKMASSSLAPSPGNFLDILGLMNSLNENTGL